jgi:hypothetical protein
VGLHLHSNIAKRIPDCQSRIPGADKLYGAMFKKFTFNQFSKEEALREYPDSRFDVYWEILKASQVLEKKQRGLYALTRAPGKWTG